MDPLLATADAAVDQAPQPPHPTTTTTTPHTPPAARLFAIADIHLSFKLNLTALEKLLPHPNDDLILAGDVGESAHHCALAFAKAKECFRTVWWVPGNHELYTLPSEQASGTRGEAKYQECVRVAREHGVLTPEDEYVLWEGAGGPVVIAPIFTLYDYSFRPAHVSLGNALAWAREMDVEATDEHLLHPDPHPSRIAWCDALLARFEEKLGAANTAYPGVPLVIINHWPLRQDLVMLPKVPRFSLWCGTTKTEGWHQRFNAKVVVSGHLHIRRTDWRDGVRFEEVSLGYPRQWEACRERGLDVNDLLREVLPGVEFGEEEKGKTVWRHYG
ncbi:metallophosphoesterase-like protein [Phaeosphaeriaceae sp. PMI808]|nr:metallophosphoesterase-like protein [Phaeosphaeriaceae sp. PMI808]